MLLDLKRTPHSILSYIVNRLPMVQPGDPSTYITYSAIHSALKLPGTPHDLDHQGLADLANAVLKADLPAITGLIVRKDTRMPGEGYFKLYRRDSSDFEWWQSEIEKTKVFDWSPYLSPERKPMGISVGPETISTNALLPPVSEDTQIPARVDTTICRVVRDTLVAIAVKKLHKYRCQICGTRISLPDGQFYAEAHHIWPLGHPHDGPDIQQNVICVCPNHHVELDHFAIPIGKETLRLVSNHQIGERYIEYHNANYQKSIRSK